MYVKTPTTIGARAAIAMENIPEIIFNTAPAACQPVGCSDGSDRSIQFVKKNASATMAVTKDTMPRVMTSPAEIDSSAGDDCPE
jgi:hypothetical protein